MLALFVVVAILVVAAVAVLVVRDRPLIEDDPVGPRALAWSGDSGVTPNDLTDVRFAVALRGYRMEEVDRVLDDTRAALASRDARVDELLRVIAGLRGVAGRPHSVASDADIGPGQPEGPEAPEPTEATDAAADPSEAGAVAPRTGTGSAQDAAFMGDNDASGPRHGPAI